MAQIGSSFAVQFVFGTGMTFSIFLRRKHDISLATGAYFE
jgi:hypothetical protein